jgi:hypothetical protein
MNAATHEWGEEKNKLYTVLRLDPINFVDTRVSQ